MIRELFLEYLSLWACVWQSTSFALVGLIGSFLLRRRPARASQVLLLALIAAVIVPAMGGLVKHLELGVFVAEPIRLQVERPTEFVPTIYDTSAAVPPPAGMGDDVRTPLEGPVLVEAGSTRSDIPWRLIGLYGWMAASLILLGRLFVAVVSGVYLLRRARPAGCEQIKRAVESARSRLAIAGDMRVRSSGSVGSQPCEDYAQSLLDFKPQKQVAFVPAVVSSKKTLAGRVRRILKDSCPNPRAGVTWALTASAIAIFLTVGIAFAQTRPFPLTGTIKTKVGQSAVIEQPAFATMTIKGRVLDPNNEPVRRTHIIALPVTSQGARADKQGYFELPWSPTWIDKGQAVYLLAKGGYPRHEAAIVEVTDPTQPVTISLEPAAKLVGRVSDPNGQQIVEYTVHLSLPTRFKCQAPILIARKKYPEPQHIFPTIPFGTKYRLTITSEGYQTRQLTVDATDRSRDVIDIGTITLQPQEATEPAVPALAPSPELAKEFRDIYRLDEREVIKIVKPPFVLGRQEFLLNGPPGFQNVALRESHVWHVRFVWDGKLQLGGSAIGMSRRLDDVMRIMLNMPYHDYDVPRELNVNMPQGDWIVRANLSMAEQLKALEEIIYAETNRPIRFENRAVERDVIIARGRYKFKQHPSGNYPDRIHLTYDGTLDRGGGSLGSLAQLFSRIEFDTRVEVVDETEPTEKTSVQYKMGDIRKIGHDPKLRGERLHALADNLAKTTSLQIEVKRRPAEMWFATEAK